MKCNIYAALQHANYDSKGGVNR